MAPSRQLGAACVSGLSVAHRQAVPRRERGLRRHEGHAHPCAPSVARPHRPAPPHPPPTQQRFDSRKESQGRWNPAWVECYSSGRARLRPRFIALCEYAEHARAAMFRSCRGPEKIRACDARQKCDKTARTGRPASSDCALANTSQVRTEFLLGNYQPGKDTYDAARNVYTQVRADALTPTGRECGDVCMCANVPVRARARVCACARVRVCV
eukprot:5170556-Pleurochrysis_carterae.AAC.5